MNSFKTTFKFFFLNVPVQMAIGLGLALLVRWPGKGVGLMRTIILLPTVTSMVVVSTLWGTLFHPNFGLINSILQSVGLPPQLFLVSPTQALPSVAVITIWKGVGVTMLFYLAGMMAIPNELYEAAKIDGANSWQLLRFITIPQLQRTTIFILMTTTIASFKVFVPVKILTGGGPFHATRVIVLYIFQLAFVFNRLGYAAAVSVILALILLAIALIQRRISREET